MNPLELANEIEESASRAEDHFTIAKRKKLTAFTLRQQHAEIEFLKDMLESVGLKRIIKNDTL